MKPLEQGTDYNYWQCFPRDHVALTLEDFGYSSEDIGGIDNYGYLYIKARSKNFISHEYQAAWSISIDEQRLMDTYFDILRRFRTTEQFSHLGDRGGSTYIGKLKLGFLIGKTSEGFPFVQLGKDRVQLEFPNGQDILTAWKVTYDKSSSSYFERIVELKDTGELNEHLLNNIELIEPFLTPSKPMSGQLRP